MAARQRPVQAARDWKGGNALPKYPASSTVKHRPVDPAAGALTPERR